jgi:hypothetical protein
MGTGERICRECKITSGVAQWESGSGGSWREVGEGVSAQVRTGVKREAGERVLARIGTGIGTNQD